MNRITLASLCFAALLPLFASCAGNDGTGRQDWPQVCPNPSSNKVRYFHATWADRGVCHAIDYACGDLKNGDEPTCLSLKFPKRMDRGDCGCGNYYPNGNKPDLPGLTLPDPPEPDPVDSGDTGDAT